MVFVNIQKWNSSFFSSSIYFFFAVNRQQQHSICWVRGDLLFQKLICVWLNDWNRYRFGCICHQNARIDQKKKNIVEKSHRFIVYWILKKLNHRAHCVQYAQSTFRWFQVQVLSMAANCIRSFKRAYADIQLNIFVCVCVSMCSCVALFVCGFLRRIEFYRHKEVCAEINFQFIFCLRCRTKPPMQTRISRNLCIYIFFCSPHSIAHLVFPEQRLLSPSLFLSPCRFTFGASKCANKTARYPFMWEYSAKNGKICIFQSLWLW